MMIIHMPQVLKCQTPLFRMDLIQFVGEGDAVASEKDAASTAEKAANDVVECAVEKAVDVKADLVEVEVEVEEEADDLKVVRLLLLPIPLDTPNTTAIMVQ